MYKHRPAVDEDFSIIAGFPQNDKELFYMYPKGTYPLSGEQLAAAALERVHPTVMLHNNEVIGYCNLYDVSDEDCWLGNVIISPAYRGKGAGKTMIETMLAYARQELNLSFFRLICHNTNTRALLFYMNLGFVPFGLKPVSDHEGHEIVGIKMELKL